MFTSALNERSRSNSLCDFRLGTVVTSDYETLLTEEEEQERKQRKEEKREDRAQKKKREEEEETSRKRTCQSSGSSDGVVSGHGSKRKMEDDFGDDQTQMDTEEIVEVEVQRWMDVTLVEEEQIELKE